MPGAARLQRSGPPWRSEWRSALALPRVISLARSGVLTAIATLALFSLSSSEKSSAEGAATAAGADVDIALVLAVDCSYSVDFDEFRQQMGGLANALRSPDVRAVIGAGAVGRIAVTVLQWSGPNSQAVVVPWRIVGNDARADALAAEIDAAPRATAEGATSVTAAIDASVVLHLRAPFRALRRVVDISADGYNNAGGKPGPSRARAEAIGITINALAILTEYSYLHHWYANHIIAGPGAFVEIADDYGAYAEAVRRKLILEIAGPIT